MRVILRAEAIAEGLTQYFTGKPCRGGGHIAPRRTASSTCVICENERKAQWKKRNPEKSHAKNAEYYARNRDDRMERNKKYYRENREKIIAKTTAYRERDRADRPEVYRERRKEYRNRFPEEFKRYANNRRQKTDGQIPRGWVSRLLILQMGKCPVCRIKLGKTYHLDHIVPVSRGGKNTKDNVQLLCPPCNARKWAKDPVEFMQSKGFLL